MVKVLRRSELERRLAVVVGTRPGIIKQSPVIRELAARRVPFDLLHSGQHYSSELDAVFFRDLDLPAPDVQLRSLEGLKSHASQMAEMLKGFEEVFLERKPMAVLVGGDANTNLAAALAARKLNIQVCHDEAGLRSYDWLMPEEHNRVIMDHIAEFLFAPSERAGEILEQEHVRGRVIVTGSTIVDAVAQNLSIAQSKSTILAALDLSARSYLLLTTHHEETVDYPEALAAVIAGASAAGEASGRKVLFPAHPRTRSRLLEFGLLDVVEQSTVIRMIEPLGYLDFLTLHAHAALTMTDSGGVIQEAAILGIPCVTLGRATEWQEVVQAGANYVAGTASEAIERAVAQMMLVDRAWGNPFGPPGASARITDVIETQVLVGDGFLPPRPVPAGRLDSSLVVKD